MIPARAVVFEAPRVVRIADVDLREPADGEVLVRTEWSGISSGTEMLAYRGEVDPTWPLDEALGSLGGTFSYPFSYGYSCVGVVERPADALAEGERVFAFHSHQDRFVAAEADVVPMAGVDARLATLFPLVETALQVSLDAEVHLGRSVVVLGLGPVGLLTALLVQRSGGEVVVVDPDPPRRALATALGLEVADPAEVRGRGEFEVAIEASGNPAALRSALPLLVHEGTVVVASWYGTKDVALPLGAEFHRRRLTIRSSQVSTIPRRLAGEWTVERRRAVARELLTDVPLKALATHEFPFERAAEAYAAVDAREPRLFHAALRYP